MPKGQKTSERGGGIYDSPETFPIVSIPPIPLEFRRIQYNTAYNEFGGSGKPEERSAGGTEGVGDWTYLPKPAERSSITGTLQV
jgi:hypothetical protein